MSNSQTDMAQLGDGVLLWGLDGTNPLGFLAALGTLQTLSQADSTKAVTLAWQNQDCCWVPVLHDIAGGKGSIAAAIAKYLNCPFRPNQQKDYEREVTEKTFQAKRNQLKKETEALKRQGLRGNQRKEADEKKLGPIRTELNSLRLQWLAALREAVPSPELSLGEHLNASCEKLRVDMIACLENATLENRAAIDLFAGFGSDSCNQPNSNRMQATPFCFITGSGHQNFLDTVRQLMEQVDAQRIEQALFSRTKPSDERLSMRWDPQEDRRYAGMWSDPTASGNKATTNWAINLLAYRGLQLCTSVPTFRSLQTTGWLFDPEPGWRWPIWQEGLTLDVVRSILSHPLLMNSQPSRELVSAIGVIALYQASRVQVGKYINFTPAYQIA